MKRWIAMLLALCLTALCLIPSALAAEKNEIVYVNLRSGGELDAVYIVNRFEASSAETIVDYGSYYKVANLSDTTPLEQNSDSVRLTVPEGTLFFQGDPVSASLPWSIRVSYALDGTPIRAEELSGKSGALEMQITIGKGSESLTDFYEHYALNMTVTLDGERCSGITAEGATIANSGTDRLLTYVALPSPDVTYTITTDVTDFAMVDISINGVPLGMDVDIDTSEIDDKLSELQDGVSQLSSGSSQLASGASGLKGGAAELQSGTTTLTESTESLVGGAAQFSAGLDEARAGSAQIVTAVNDLDGKTQGAPQMSIREMRTLCNALLDAMSQQERALTDLRGKISTLVSLAESLEGGTKKICDLIPESGFSTSDVSLLRTLLSRGSSNSDVSSALSSEIAALRRILDRAEEINGCLDELRSCAEENHKLAVSLSEPLKKLDGQIGGALAELAEVKASLQATLSMLDAMETNGASSDDGVMTSLFAMIREMDAGIQALDTGLGELQASFALLSAGISSVDAGADSLASGADTLLDGASSLSSGANSLKGGVDELSEGTSGMDEQVQEGVDDTISSITGGDFEPVSYADPRNMVESVQFVIRIPGVSEAEEPEIAVEEEIEKSLGEKFLDLFR